MNAYTKFGLILFLWNCQAIVKSNNGAAEKVLDMMKNCLHHRDRHLTPCSHCSVTWFV